MTEEIKNLVGKKHDYYQKLNNNKRALENIHSYLDKTKVYFETTKIKLKDKEKINEIESETNIKTIIDLFFIIDNELAGNDEEVLEKINKNILTIKESFGLKIEKVKKKSISPKIIKNEKRKLKVFSVEDSLAQEKINKNKYILPEIKTVNYKNINSANDNSKSMKNPLKKDVGVFNKYEYLSKRQSSPLPHYMQKNNKPQTVEKKHFSRKIDEFSSRSIEKRPNIKNNVESDLLSEDEERQLEEELRSDFETTNDKNYENLKKRKNKLKQINHRVSQNILENESNYNKKMDEMELTIEHNQQKLKALQQQNELLSIEIDDIKKIMSLNNEENMMTKEVKESELKLIKDANISQTRHEILQDLNILKSDDSFIFTHNAGKEIIQSLNKNSNSTSLNNSNNKEDEEESQDDEYENNSNNEVSDDGSNNEQVNRGRELKKNSVGGIKS